MGITWLLLPLTAALVSGINKVSELTADVFSGDYQTLDGALKVESFMNYFELRNRVVHLDPVCLLVSSYFVYFESFRIRHSSAA